MSSACRKRRVGAPNARSADAPRAAGRRSWAVSVGRQACCVLPRGRRITACVAVVMRTEMQLLLLGPFEVVTDLGERRLPGRGERALLALLALSAGQVGADEPLVDALWSSGDLPVDPGNALQLRVSKLRRALAASTPGPGSTGWLRLPAGPGPGGGRRAPVRSTRSRRRAAPGTRSWLSIRYDQALACGGASRWSTSRANLGGLVESGPAGRVAVGRHRGARRTDADPGPLRAGGRRPGAGGRGGTRPGSGWSVS